MRVFLLCLFLAQGCVMTNTVRVLFHESTAPEQDGAIELDRDGSETRARVVLVSEDEKHPAFETRGLPAKLSEESLRVTRLPDPEPPDLKPWQLGLLRANQTPRFRLERKHTKDWQPVADIAGFREERGFLRRLSGWALMPAAVAADITLFFTVGLLRLMGLG